MILNSFPSIQIGNGHHGRITGKDESHHLFRPAFFEEAGRFFKGCARRCNIIGCLTTFDTITRLFP